MRRILVVASLVLLSLTASAVPVDRSELLARLEASMVIEGAITITPEGGVESYVIDDAEVLSEGMRGVVDATVRRWRFQPVLRDGRPVTAHARMTLRAVARRLDNGDLQVRIAGAHFQDEATPPVRRGKRLAPPTYPMELARKGVSGTVYLVLRLSADGRVEAGIAEQVNLMTGGSERDMAGWRDRLADASLRAARRWTFDPATLPDEAGREAPSVRVPVDFLMAPLHPARPGDWQPYLPGPRMPIPWETGADAAAAPADAIASDGVQLIDGSGPRLLSPLDAVQG